MHAISLTDEQSVLQDRRSAFSNYLCNITDGEQASDQRVRTEARLAGERRLLEMVASGCALPEILAALCCFVEGTAADCYCSVYLVDWRKPQLRNVAAPSLPASFYDPIESFPLACESAPCARAVCLKTQVVAEDVESDPLWQASPFRSLALAHGLRSCWSTPICSAAGQVLGTCAILQRQPSRPTAFQQDLIAHATCVASIAIERAQGEAALGKARSELAHVTRVMSLGALTASIAHEINQPLSGIVTNAGAGLRMLAAEPPNVDGARETARRTLRDANRAADIIRRLRALFAKKAATSEAVDLNEAAREVIALSSCDLQRRRVVLRPEFAADLPAVTGDRVQLQQVVLNLLLNAADAMSDIEDRPRQVVIRTERDEGGRVRLSVRDLGVGFGTTGMPLFEPFYTTKGEGMGIGLSVSRFIIESHQGRLWATSNEGPGATFSFSIPCRPG